MNFQRDSIRLGRRAFLHQGTLVLATSLRANAMGARAMGFGATETGAGAVPATEAIMADDGDAKLRVALVTDLHYADKDPAGSRHYRETLAKLDDAAPRLQAEPLTFLVELGDLIDAADSVDVELSYLQTINRAFAKICPQRHYVLGNHCVDILRKDEFLAEVEQPQSYYSFDREGFHFVVLDSCFRGDGQPYGRKNAHWTDANLSPEELEWLAGDLQTNVLPVIVFAHQRLDVDNDYGVKNAAAARQLLEASGKVLAVFQGHSHRNEVRQIGEIHYCTLVAMVEGSGLENSGYSLLEIFPSGTLRLHGFRQQASHHWPAP